MKQCGNQCNIHKDILIIYMKVITKSNLSKSKHNLVGAKLRTSIDGYCCEELGKQELISIRFSKRSTYLHQQFLQNLSSPDKIANASFTTRTNLDSQIHDNDHTIQRNCVILTVGQINKIKKIDQSNSLVRRQKIEVSLSKRKNPSIEKKIVSFIPKLSEVGGNYSLLRSFSKNNKIVNAVQSEIDKLILKKINYCK